jgi:hypothetical protein
MQQFRINKPKPSKSSKPAVSWSERRALLAASISISENKAMVSCTPCVNNGVVCYYDRHQSVKCAECLCCQRDCDGTFSVEEFRKVGEQKKRLQAESRAKRREIAHLRGVLAEVEAEDVGIQDSLAQLEERSSRMLRREMQALGVMDSLGTEQEVVLGDSAFAWAGLPVTESIDWDAVLGSGGDNSQGSPG